MRYTYRHTRGNNQYPCRHKVYRYGLVVYTTHTGCSLTHRESERRVPLHRHRHALPAMNDGSRNRRAEADAHRAPRGGVDAGAWLTDRQQQPRHVLGGRGREGGGSLTGSSSRAMSWGGGGDQIQIQDRGQLFQATRNRHPSDSPPSPSAPHHSVGPLRDHNRRRPGHRRQRPLQHPQGRVVVERVSWGACQPPGEGQGLLRGLGLQTGDPGRVPAGRRGEGGGRLVPTPLSTCSTFRFSSTNPQVQRTYL